MPPETEAVSGLIGLLLQGPPDPRLRSALSPGTTSPSQAEAGDALVLEMSEPFWSGPPEEIRRRAAQVVFTMASLEEGKRVTLLNGLVPGEVTGVNGEVLQQPLARHDFPDLRPWIQVIQPVAGAVVGSDVPVRVLSRGDHPLRVSVTDRSDATVVSETVRRDGDSVGPIPPDAPEELTITIGSRIGGALRKVDVPVRFGL